MVGLVRFGERIKYQQALTRSCQASTSLQDEIDQLDAVLKLLTAMRRRQRTLLRLWRGLAPETSHNELVREVKRFDEEYAEVDALIESWRARSLTQVRAEALEGWRELAEVARRHLRVTA